MPASVPLSVSSMPPVLDLDADAPGSTNTTVTFQEEQGRVRLLNSSSHTVTASSSVSQVTLTLLNRPNGFSEYLELAQLTGVSVAVQEDFANTGSFGSLFLMGNFSSDTVVQILGEVYYVNSDPNPRETTARMIRIVIDDDAGRASEPAFISLFIEPYNNAPTISLGGPGLTNYTTVFTVGGACVSLTSSSVQVSDADSLGITSVSVSLQSTGSNGSDEFLAIEGTIPNTTYLSTNEIVMILSNPSFAAYEEELPQIVYCNTANEPDSSARVVSIIATDLGLLTYDNTSALPAAYSQPAYTIIEISTVNNPPTLYVEPAITTGGSAPTTILLRGSTRLTDIDSIRFSQIRISLSNAPDGPDEEIILFPPGASLVGPTVDGSMFLYTYTFEGLGGTVDNVTEVLEGIRYQNNNPNINTTAVRRLCIQVSDSESLSNQECIDLYVADSSDNVFSPVFSQPLYNFTVVEVSSHTTVGNVMATDIDLGRSGQVLYMIASGSSSSLDINPVTGELTAPVGLDADTYTDLVLSVMAVDLGNPARTATVQVVVQVTDINDNAPQFVFPNGGPTYSVSIAESTNTTITVVKATDADITSPNNLIEYSLFGAPFVINFTTGDIPTSDLDYETVEQYTFTVTATDGGAPRLASTANVTLTVIDINDNPTTVYLPLVTYYLLQHEPLAQYPIAAAQLFDIDPSDTQLAEVNVTLLSTGNESRPYSTCLEDCQDVRLAAAGLTASTELTGIADYFEGEVNTSISAPEVLIGDGDCSAVRLTRGAAADGSGDTFGRISSTALPPGFGDGEYSISFVANITDAGYIFLAVDTDDPTQPHSRVNFEVGLQIAETKLVFEYIHGTLLDPGTFEYTLSSDDPFNEFFSTGVGTTRHYVLVIHSDPTPAIDVYVDCTLLVNASLAGTVVAPDVQFGLFLGQSVPRPVTTDGRLSGTIHGLYYHPYALNDTQISDFCLCGEEYLNVPAPLLATISLSADSDHVSFKPSNNFSAIPTSDALQALRQVQYVNTFSVPTTGQPPNLVVTVTDVDEQVATSSTQITFLSQVQAPVPLLDLNGPGNGGNNTVTFVEASGPVPLVSTSATLVWVGLEPEAPTFTEVSVELVGALGPGEALASSSTDYISVVPVSASSFTLVGPGTAAEFIEALRSITYDNTNPRLSSTERQVLFRVYDTFGEANEPLVYSVIVVESINQAPIINNLPTSVAYQEGSTVVVAPDLTISDADSENISTATVTISSPTQDDLSVSLAPPTVETSFSGHTLTITGEALLSEYELLLQTLQYSSSDNPVLDERGRPLSAAANRSIVISITDAEGAMHTTVLPITFQPVNDRPVILITTVELLFNGSSESALPIVPHVSVSDPDSEMWQSMRVTLNTAVDGDYLDDGSITSRVLIYGPTNSLDNYSMILQSVTYNNPRSIPTPVPRKISVEICDFQDCGSAYITIEVDPLVCQLNSCLNGGTCVEGLALQSSCICDFRFTGEFCEVVSPVELQQFNFDLDSGQLLLTFHFPGVNISTLNVSGISLHDTFVLPTHSFTLTGIEGTHEGLALQHNLTLLASDLDAIKAIEGLASSTSNTYLSLREGVYLDALGRPVAALPVEFAIQVTLYIPDSTSPSLLLFDLLETPQEGVSLVLLFTETVAITSLDHSGLTLLTAPSSSLSYQLTGAITPSPNSPQIEIYLTVNDVTAIRENFYPLGSSPTTTYLSASNFTITDTARNFLVPIQVDTALLVDTLTADFNPPTIITFSLDMDVGVLSVTFSEEIRPSSLNLSLISLHGASGDQVVTLGGGDISTEASNSSVNIALSETELDSLKVSPGVASALNNTFLAVEAGYVVDTVGNTARDIPDSLQVTDLQLDTTNPLLELFTFDLDGGEMVLSFTEPMDENSLAADQLVLTNTTATFSPASVVTISLTPRTISISLSQVDLNQIKQAEICLSESTCNLYFPGSPGEIVGTDYAGNILIEIPSSSPIRVYNFSNDTTPPQLLQFILDLNTGTIELAFSETVALSSLDPTQIFLQSSNTFEDSFYALQLAGGSLSDRTNSDRVQIGTTIDDLNSLKILTGLCTNSSNCHIAVTHSLVVDVSGNVLESVSLSVDEFVADQTRPFVVSFDFDLTAATVILTFDEAIRPVSFQPHLVTLQNSVSATENFTLTGGVVSLANFYTVVTLALTQMDAIYLQANLELATGLNDTFLRIASGVEDLSGNLAQSVVEAIPVRVYTEDSVAPHVVSVDLLDLNIGMLVLSLNEPVGNDVNINGITICSSAVCNSTSYTLTSATSMYTDSLTKTNVSLELDTADVIALKLLFPNIATSELDSFFAVQSGTFQDTAGNNNVPLSTAQRVGTYIPDTTPPTLSGFTLDLNNDQLNLIFNDVVSVDSLDPLGITIQSAENESTNSVQLTGGIVLSGNGIELALQLTPGDVGAIVSNPALGTVISNTFISIAEAAVFDITGNGISATSGLQAGMVIRDNPLLLRVEFDLNFGILSFSFSEDVDPDSFNTTEITLLNMPNGTHSYRLTGGSILTAEASNRTDIALSSFDLNSVKALPLLATFLFNTYVSITEETVADLEGNRVVPVSSLSALQATTFTEDTSQPQVRSFSIQTGSVVLAVTFTETINASSVDPTGFTLLQSPNASDAITLTGGNLGLENSPQIQITLTNNDVERIRGRFPLGSSPETTYLSVSPTAAADMSGNTVSPPNTPLRVTSVTADFVPPEPLHFTLDVNSGTVAVVFTEDVRLSTVNISKFLLQDAPANSRIVIALSRSVLNATADINTQIELRLSESVQDSVKISGIGASVSNAYISLSLGAVADALGNPIQPSTLQATDLITDTIPPTLSEFSFDLDSGQMLVSFSEPVLLSSLKLADLVLSMTSHAPDGAALSPSTGNASVQGTRQVFIELSNGDLNELKRLEICIQRSSCYLSFSPNATLADYANQTVSPFEPLQAADHVSDMTPPTVLSVSLDMDHGTLELGFSEPVNTASFSAEMRLRLQDAPREENSTHYILTGGHPSQGNTTLVILSILDRDLNEVKSLEPLCNNRASCYVYYGAGLVDDVSGNPTVPPAQGLMLSTFIPDSTQPRLLTFDLDLNTGVMALYFDETVDSATFLPGGLTIQNSPIPTASVNLSTDTPFDNSRRRDRFSFTMLTEDIVRIQTAQTLATGEDDTFLNLSENTVSDTSGNPSVASGPVAVGTYTADTTRPQLSEFSTLDMDEGLIELYFSEPVTTSDIDLSRISLCSTPECSTFVTLSNASQVITTQPTGVFLQISVSTQDLYRVKQEYPDLASSPETTWVNLESGSFADTAGNLVLPTVANVSIYQADRTQPNLLAFRLDVNQGRLVLEFDDVMNTSSAVAKLLTLQSSIQPSESVLLSSETRLLPEQPLYDNILEFVLGENDLTSIRLQAPNLATSTDNTYISLTVADNAFLDVFRNQVNGINESSALQASSVTQFMLECQNDGVFIPGNLECECVEGYNGTLCENDVDVCPYKDPCNNGGTCMEGVGAMVICSCPDGYSGTTCNFPTGELSYLISQL